MSAFLGLLALLSASPAGLNAGTTPTPVSLPATLTSFEWQSVSSPQYVGVPFAVTILARDENGASYDYDGTAFLSTSLGAYVQPAVVQFYNGRCATNIIVTLAENLSLRCFTDAASGLSNEIEVATGAPARFVTILPGEQLAPGIAGGRGGNPNNQVAGDSFSFQVYITDGWYNPIESGDDSIYFASDDRFGRLPAGGQLSDGTGTFAATLRTAGQRHVFTRPAAGESLLVDTSAALNVVPGPFVQMLMVAPGETLLPGDTTSVEWNSPGKAGDPNKQYLRVPFSMTVYPCDRCWNRTTGPGDTVYFNSFFPFDVNPWRTLLLDSAVFEVRANWPSAKENVWAADPQSNIYSYSTWLDIEALGASLEITAEDTIRAGETTGVRIRVLDANSDPIVAALVKCAVFRGSGTLLDSALLTDTIGEATARFVCTPSPAAEQDSVRITSGEAATAIGIYVTHLSDSLFAFPNPFGSVNRDRTTIFYSLSRAVSVKVTIFDPFGNRVWTRRYSQGEPGGRFGDNTIEWDGTNQKGQRVAGGVYLVQVLGTTGTGINYRSLYRVGVVW